MCVLSAGPAVPQHVRGTVQERVVKQGRGRGDDISSGGVLGSVEPFVLSLFITGFLRYEALR